MTDLSDAALRALIDRDPPKGWRVFVDQYTSTLLALIERAGVADRDDQADVYVRICERLAADDCARLRGYDAAKGALTAWLTVVVRHAAVDWVRSRAGRRRLFESIERLGELDRRVFELRYWERHQVTEIAEMLSQTPDRRVSIPEVLDALDRIERAMSDRQRGELLVLMSRNTRAVALDDQNVRTQLELVHRDPDPEMALRVKNLDDAFGRAIGELGAEEAAIVRMVYVHGWTLQEVRRALHLRELTRERLTAILARLRATLERHGIGAAEAATPGLTFLEDHSE